jgi:esterase/lipase superfamily enzyme
MTSNLFMKKIIPIFLAFSFLTSCANLENNEELQKKLKPIWSEYFKEDFNDSKAINVFVVTNRKAKNNAFSCADDGFGVDVDSKLQSGICKINVPKNHNIGEITFAKDARQSSDNYFKILETKTLQESELIDAIKKTKRTPLVFVHGFNVRYQEAVLRASQIAYDLKYQGPIILFTWPAGAKDGFLEDAMLNKTYENNFSNAKASIDFFKNFLLKLQGENIKINLLVHSMGHQVVLPALRKLNEEKPKKVFINELFLNAPDFDIIEFRAISKNIKSISNHVTLYCSNNDKAMSVSKTFNKNERLGACIALEDMDAVNVSLIDDPSLGLGHGYYSSRAVLNDVFQTLLGIDVKHRLSVAKSDIFNAEKFSLRK